MAKRKFTTEQKLSILKEAATHGVKITLEEHRRHAFVLTIIDTFTRVALAYEVGYSMKWTRVAKAWEDVIVNHLQPADLLAKDIHVEVRSDDGPQFLATRLREFMADDHLGQVSTHPYTPQENGHVESFHSFYHLTSLTVRAVHDIGAAKAALSTLLREVQ